MEHKVEGTDQEEQQQQHNDRLTAFDPGQPR